jgi:hypothetical protein
VITIKLLEIYLGLSRKEIAHKVDKLVSGYRLLGLGMNKALLLFVAF